MTVTDSESVSIPIPPALAGLEVYVNGSFHSADRPVFSAWDHGIMYGDGVFEGIRAYDGKVFKLDAHLDRLYASAKIIRLQIPLTKEEMRAIVLDTIRRNGLRDAHIRPIVTRGVGMPGMDVGDGTPTVAVLAYPKAPPGRKPIRCLVSTVRRKSPLSIDPRVKSLNYLDSVLARQQALAAGYDDAIMLDHQGCIAEGTGANLFVITRGALYTPTLVAALAGITRSIIIERAPELGLSVLERDLSPGDLYAADEAFLCGTGYEIVPIGEADGRVIGDGSIGPWTKRIADDFDAIKTTVDVVDAYSAGAGDAPR